MVIASACARASAPSSSLVGVWEDEFPQIGGQLPGGTFWEFRSDGTFSALTGILATTRGDGTSQESSPRTTTNKCTWVARRVTADGTLQARMLWGMDDRGGRYSMKSNVVVLDSVSEKYAGEFRVTASPGKITLRGVGTSIEHRLVRVDWYRLPSLSVIRQCSSTRSQAGPAAQRGAATDKALRSP